MAGKFEKQNKINMLKSLSSLLLAIAIMLGTYWLSTLSKESFNKRKQEAGEAARYTVTGTNNTRSEANTNSVRHTDSEAWSCATAIVEENPKSPSTADFCSFTEATITHVGNGEYMVVGWVDAKNVFGSTVRESFVVTYIATTSGYKNGNVIFS